MWGHDNVILIINNKQSYKFGNLSQTRSKKIGLGRSLPNTHGTSPNLKPPKAHVGGLTLSGTCFMIFFFLRWGAKTMWMSEEFV